MAANGERRREATRLRNEEAARHAKSITSLAFGRAVAANGERRQEAARAAEAARHAKSITSLAFAGAVAANGERRRAAEAKRLRNAREAAHNAHMRGMFANVNEILNEQEAARKAHHPEDENEFHDAREVFNRPAKPRVWGRKSPFWGRKTRVGGRETLVATAKRRAEGKRRANAEEKRRLNAALGRLASSQPAAAGPLLLENSATYQRRKRAENERERLLLTVLRHHMQQTGQIPGHVTAS